MKKNYLWTKSKGRLELVNSSGDKNYNWLFLPGGPGFGSESLSGLKKILNLPGQMWLVDLPGDGSNHIIPYIFCFIYPACLLLLPSCEPKARANLTSATALPRLR